MFYSVGKGEIGPTFSKNAQTIIVYDHESYIIDREWKQLW